MNSLESNFQYFKNNKKLVTHIKYNLTKINKKDHSKFITSTRTTINFEYSLQQWSIYKSLNIDSNEEIKNIFSKLDFTIDTTYYSSNKKFNPIIYSFN